MKVFLTVFAVAAGCHLLSTGLAEPEKTGPGSLRLALDLIDGSHIVGTPAIEQVPVVHFEVTGDTHWPRWTFR